MAATYLKLIITVIIWGGTWVAARIVVREVDPLAVASWRFCFSVLTLLALVRWHHGEWPRLNRTQAWQVLALGVTGIYLYNVCFLFGMQHLAAGQGALVVALNPLLVTLGASIWLGEAMTPNKAVGAAIALVGCLTVIGHGSPLAPLRGEIGFNELLILSCAGLWAAYTLIGRQAMRSLSPLTVTAYASVVGWVLLLATSLTVKPAALVPDYSPLAWSMILFLGLLGTTLGFTWFNQAVKKIGAARASIFINLVPVAAVLQGAWLLDEQLDWPVLLGGLLVLCGVILTQGFSFKLPRTTSS